MRDRYTQCPNCDADCESESCDSEYINSRKEMRTIWEFICDECGCEFSITETEVTKTTSKTEVTKEGKVNAKQN